MTTREKAILWLNSFVKNKEPMTLIPKQLIRLMYEALTEQPEIVRCKDCKHRPTQTESEKEGYTLEFPDYICPCQCDDGWYSWYPKDNWFCANGEHK